MVLMRPRRRLPLSLGVVLLILAIAVSFCWFHWLEPLRGFIHARENPDPLGLREEWARTKNRLRQTGWGHFDSDIVGRFGDKEFLAEVLTAFRS